jgi:hypothetical protein
MHFLPPVSSTDISVTGLKEKVFHLMWEDYLKNAES